MTGIAGDLRPIWPRYITVGAAAVPQPICRGCWHARVIACVHSQHVSACGQAFAADLERLFGELEQMEPEITVIAGRGGEATSASVSLDETRVNRVILQVHARCLRRNRSQPRCIELVLSSEPILARCHSEQLWGRVMQGVCLRSRACAGTVGCEKRGEAAEPWLPVQKGVSGQHC